MLSLFIPWVLSEDGGLHSEHPPTPTGRGPGGIVCPGMLATVCLGMLSELIFRLFNPTLGSYCSSLWC